MRFLVETKKIGIKKFGNEELYNPNYMSWLRDRDTLLSLNLMDYILNPVDLAILTQYVESFSSKERDELFAIYSKEAHSFVGTVALREIGYGGLYDLGILVGDKLSRGKGFAKDAISLVTHYAFNTMSARKVCSSFAVDNIAVLLAFLKNGFVIEGLQRDQQFSIEGITKSRYIVGILKGEV
jgi:RimJ/RimL family protein N-acetyltransferase